MESRGYGVKGLRSYGVMELWSYGEGVFRFCHSGQVLVYQFLSTKEASKTVFGIRLSLRCGPLPFTLSLREIP